MSLLQPDDALSGGANPVSELLLSHRRGLTGVAYQRSNIDRCFNFVSPGHSTDLHLPLWFRRSRQGLPVRLTVLAHVLTFGTSRT